MKSLDYRDTSFSAGRINRRRNHDKRVVHMDNIGALRLQNRCKTLARPLRPDHPRRNTDAVHQGIVFQFHVATDERNYCMTGPFKKAFFALKNHVFSARLAIGIVNKNNFHELFRFVRVSSSGWDAGFSEYIATNLCNSCTSSVTICRVVLSRPGSGAESRPEMASRNLWENSARSSGANIFSCVNSSGAHPAYFEHKTGMPERTASLATRPQTSSSVGKTRRLALR